MFRPYKRLLKELGLYAAWRKEIMKHVRKGNIYLPTFLEKISYKKSFCGFLSSSFVWVSTENAELWPKLALPYCSSFKPNVILEHEEYLCTLKEIIKAYAKKRETRN